MGKRELVLILAFVLAGMVVYRVTAPATAPGQSRFSLGRVIQNVRRGIQGRHVHATVKTTRVEPIEASTTELRVNVRYLDLAVVGEDRRDVAFDLAVDSNGTDEADAKRLAAEAELRLDHAGGGLLVAITFPEDGTQRATLTIHAPSRLAVRVESKIGRLDVANVASLDVKGNRGATTIKHVKGEAAVTHRGGALHVDGTGSLRLSGAGAEGDVTNVHGNASIELTGSRVTLSAISGSLDVRAQGTDIDVRDIGAARGPLRFDLQSGKLDATGVRTETRVDGRNTEIDIAVDRPVPITIYNTSDDVTVTPPAGGYTLDVVATDGGLTIEDGDVKPSGDDREKRASGSVRGGGPTISVRDTNGHITIRRHAGK